MVSLPSDAEAVIQLTLKNGRRGRRRSTLNTLRASASLREIHHRRPPTAHHPLLSINLA